MQAFIQIKMLHKQLYDTNTGNNDIAIKCNSFQQPIYHRTVRVSNVK